MSKHSHILRTFAAAFCNVVKFFAANSNNNEEKPHIPIIYNNRTHFPHHPNGAARK